MFERVPSFRAVITRKASWLLYPASALSCHSNWGFPSSSYSSSSASAVLLSEGGLEDVGTEPLLNAQAVEVNDRPTRVRPQGDSTLKRLEGKLVTVLGDRPRREALLREAKQLLCEESIQFVMAILEWEHLGSKREMRMKRGPAARRIVDRFVREGSEMENGCLSSQTRQDLLIVMYEEISVCDDLFDEAKQEVLNDIWMNPSLKRMIENQFELMMFIKSASNPHRRRSL